MGKRKKHNVQLNVPTSASSELDTNPDSTIVPGVDPPTGTTSYNDATSIDDLPNESITQPYAGTYATLLDKYLLSNKGSLPIIQIALIIIVIACGWIFVQDNGSGSFRQGDWSAILWYLEKCAALVLLICLVVIGYFMLKKLKAKFDKHKK